MKTYMGWTEEEIREAETNGEHIPDDVWIAYTNDDYDGSDR